MAHRCFTLLGAPDLWIRLGWLEGSTRNGMKWGTLTLLETTHSRGCYLKFAVLLVQSVCSPRRPKTKDPGLRALEAYIAGDTLRHQPMGAGHMTVLQSHGPMGLCVLQWCHPMLACAKRTSYCTWIITLYGAGKWIQARANTHCLMLEVLRYIAYITLNAFNCVHTKIKAMSKVLQICHRFQCINCYVCRRWCLELLHNTAYRVTHFVTHVKGVEGVKYYE